MVDNDPIIREHLGDVYTQTGQYEKALAAYEKAYELYEEEAKKQKVNAKIHSIKSRSAK